MTDLENGKSSTDIVPGQEGAENNADNANGSEAGADNGDSPGASNEWWSENGKYKTPEDYQNAHKSAVKAMSEAQTKAAELARENAELKARGLGAGNPPPNNDDADPCPEEQTRKE